MKEITLSDIERINVAILVIGSILTMVIMREFRHVFSFAVGSAAMTANFRFLRKIIEGGLLGANVRKRDLAVKLPLKFLALMGLVVIVVVYGDVNVWFFLIGLSTVFISVVIHQIQLAFTPAERRRQKNGA